MSFRINFITLTLSDKQAHSDKYIKEYLLKPYCKWLISKGATGYVWKAEKQRNGNIHFHITTNIYIHYLEIRQRWNDLQNKHGYMDKYFLEHGDHNPNSTDVKSVKHEQKALQYMMKYICKKQADRDQVQERDFGYSRNLTNIKLVLDLDNEEAYEVMNYLASVTTDTMKFDYVTLYERPLLNLESCPQYLRDLIHQQMNREPEPA